MSKYTMYRRRGSSTPTPNQAQNFIAAITALDGAPSTTTANAIGFLFGELSSFGLWPKLYDVVPMVGNGIASALMRLRDSSGAISSLTGHSLVNGDFVETGGSAGITFNGSTKYASGLAQCTLMGLDCTMYADIRAWTAASNQAPIGGLPEGTRVWNIDSNNTGTAVAVQAGTNTVAALSGAFAAGRYAGVSIGPNLLNQYRNHVQVGTDNTTRATTAVSGDLYMGAQNSAGTPISFFNGRLSFLCTGQGLTLGEMTDLDNIVSLFQTAMGRA